jgi:predicted HTH transcriptional regulator
MKKTENYKPIGEERSAGVSRNSGGVGEGSGKEAINELRNEVLAPLEQDLAKLRDPFVLAAIMNTAATERENTNRLLKTIIEKLDTKFAEVDSRIMQLEAAQNAPQAMQLHDEEVLLPSVDEEIVKFIKEKRHVTAEAVRARFGYKGKNAASSRLNRLYEMGLLEKRQVGRAVMYHAKKP